MFQTDIREKMYEVRTQTSVDNTANDLCCEIKFWKIIIRIHIAANKYTVNKTWRMTNEQRYGNIYKIESIQKHYLNYYIRKLRLGERRSILLIYVMAQKMKDKKSELQCYINAPENLSVSKTYLISIYIFIIFFKAVTWASIH